MSKLKLETVLTLTVDELLEATAHVAEKMTNELGEDDENIFFITMLCGVMASELPQAILEVQAGKKSKFAKGDKVRFTAEPTLIGTVVGYKDDGSIEVKIGKHGTSIYATDEGVLEHVADKFN